MREAVRAKFRQHAEIRAALLATATAHLVEHTSNDRAGPTAAMAPASTSWD